MFTRSDRRCQSNIATNAGIDKLKNFLLKGAKAKTELQGE